MLGSEGDDLFNGGDGDDMALMGAGDDTFVWNPGDDNDTLEGQAGFDTMLFNGANVAENIDISANGERVRFFRNIANVTMDLERRRAHRLQRPGRRRQHRRQRPERHRPRARQHQPRGASAAAATAQADTVTLIGTNGDDRSPCRSVDGNLVVDGLATQVVIRASRPRTTSWSSTAWPATTWSMRPGWRSAFGITRRRRRRRRRPARRRRQRRAHRRRRRRRRCSATPATTCSTAAPATTC